MFRIIVDSSTITKTTNLKAVGSSRLWQRWNVWCCEDERLSDGSLDS